MRVPDGCEDHARWVGPLVRINQRRTNRLWQCMMCGARRATGVKSTIAMYLRRDNSARYKCERKLVPAALPARVMVRRVSYQLPVTQ